MKGGADNPSLSQPMIKVVSNSQNIAVAGITTVSGGAAASITQKIKFKTPLPKPKVKAKFKPLVPLQRPNLLSSTSGYGENIILGSNTATTVTVTSSSPNKSSLSAPSQGMSVKVVQVTKSSSSSSSSSASLLMSGLNKPVVVVSNSSLKTPQKLTFSGVPSSVTQQLKVMATASSSLPTSSSTSVTQPGKSGASGTLTSKSMPLATGFKMIAVTTVVPGTTQVKTVYIATPIMSLPKTVSQSSNTSITTAAPQQQQLQNIRHISSSLASNLQSVVARSIGTNNNNNSSNIKAANIIQASVASPSASATTNANRMQNKLLSNQSKGLGSYKTTLAGTAQSLKLFSAATKSKTLSQPTATGTVTVPKSSSLASFSSNSHNQRLLGVNTAPSKASDVRLRTTSNLNKADLNGSFLNIGMIGGGLNNPLQESHITMNGPAVLSTTDIGAITGDVLNSGGALDEVNATLNLLNEENANMTTEQITATGTGETYDMAYLNAGEKFLEKLTAKMTATSPDGQSKTETFLFPSNLSLDINNQGVVPSTVFDVNDYDTLVGSSISIDKGGGGIPSHLQNGNMRQPALLAKGSSSLNSSSTNNFFLAHKGAGGGGNTISSTKLLNNLLPSGAKVLPSASNALSIGHYTQNAIVGQQHLQSSVMSPMFQNTQLAPPQAAAAILNYTNITNVSGKNMLGLLENVATNSAGVASDLNKVGGNSSAGFITVGGVNQVPASGIVIDAGGVGGGVTKSRLSSGSMKMNSSNKLPMSIPGSSKLNISPLLSNSKVQASTSSSIVTSSLGGGSDITSAAPTFQDQLMQLGALENPSSSLSSSIAQTATGSTKQLLQNNLQSFFLPQQQQQSATTISINNSNNSTINNFVDSSHANRLTNNDSLPPLNVAHQTPLDKHQQLGGKRKINDILTPSHPTRSPVSWVRSAAK